MLRLLLLVRAINCHDIFSKIRGVCCAVFSKSNYPKESFSILENRERTRERENYKENLKFKIFWMNKNFAYQHHSLLEQEIFFQVIIFFYLKIFVQYRFVFCFVFFCFSLIFNDHSKENLRIQKIRFFFVQEKTKPPFQKNLSPTITTGIFRFFSSLWSIIDRCDRYKMVIGFFFDFRFFFLILIFSFFVLSLWVFSLLLRTTKTKSIIIIRYGGYRISVIIIIKRIKSNQMMMMMIIIDDVFERKNDDFCFCYN